jgi:hypothetical protein
LVAFISLWLLSFRFGCFRFALVAFVSLWLLSFRFGCFRFTLVAFVSLWLLSFHFGWFGTSPGFLFRSVLLAPLTRPKDTPAEAAARASWSGEGTERNKWREKMTTAGRYTSGVLQWIGFN